MIGSDERRHLLLDSDRDDISIFEVSPDDRLTVSEDDYAVFVERNEHAGRDGFFAIGKEYGDASAGYVRVRRRGDHRVGRFEIRLVTNGKSIVVPPNRKLDGAEKGGHVRVADRVAYDQQAGFRQCPFRDFPDHQRLPFVLFKAGLEDALKRLEWTG